jgi:hypothetical protein
MNHQTAETKLEFSLREQERERIEKEKARFYLSRLIKIIKSCPPHVAFFVTSTPEFEAADAYLNPPMVKKPYANDEEGRI